MPGVFEICVETHFSAAHSLIGYQGNCAQIHGHNWIVEVFVRCRELNDIGIGIDFRDVRQAIKDLIKDLDHSYLNEYPEFKNTNPSSENIAKFLYRELGGKINSDNVKISKVKVSETRGAGAYYWEE
ncbi:MAG: 6-carboxytetrahydropterin synthase QueD [Deltaproteobacteria bacterium]|nr:6-carboxytetrahydropterin synthase QueD [Deltaproteobacteria bacterium]